MSKTSKNYFLLLVLTFLQCLTPLLHAHAGGMHASSHIHVHADGLELSAFHADHETGFKTDLCDSPVVGAVSEFRRDSTYACCSGALSATPWLIVPYSIYVAAIAVSSSLSHTPFRAEPPPSQAPPAFV